MSSAAMQPLVLPPSWQSSLGLAVSQQTASEADAAMGVDGDPPVYLVRGPKKTGKSTFARTLINRLLNRFVLSRSQKSGEDTDLRS
jgi:polynucleotide 5'-hydroxyl-kinase GRC3/NOL9